MKPAIRRVFSRLENHTGRSVINEFKRKSGPSRILCCHLISLIGVSTILSARTDCAHHIHKECEPGKAVGTLEGATVNCIGKIIGKSFVHWGERKR